MVFVNKKEPNILYKNNLEIIFSLIKDNYPFKNSKDFLNFCKKYNNYNSLLGNIKTDEDFYILSKKFVASLGDTHTKIAGYPWKFYKPKLYRVVFDSSKFFLFKKNTLIGKIISIDGQKPELILKKAIELISGKSKKYLINQGLSFILADITNKLAKIKIKNDSRIKMIILKRVLINHFKKQQLIQSRMINNIFYLKIRAWAQSIKDNIEQKVQEINKGRVEGLIIDVRGNLGGNSVIADLLAGHFFKEDILFRRYLVRKNNLDFSLFEKEFWLKSYVPHINIPIIILVDKESFSSNELFIAGMKDTGRALILGEKTGGGTGNPKIFEISSGKYTLKLFISSWIVKRLNGQLIEGRGINPDLAIKLKLSDIKKNKDVILEKALEKITKLSKKKGI